MGLSGHPLCLYHSFHMVKGQTFRKGLGRLPLMVLFESIGDAPEDHSQTERK